MVSVHGTEEGAMAVAVERRLGGGGGLGYRVVRMEVME
jgi:hypothetical protein